MSTKGKAIGNISSNSYHSMFKMLNKVLIYTRKALPRVITSTYKNADVQRSHHID